MQISPVSVFVVLVAILVAVLKSGVTFHLYPVAPAEGFQFQMIWVGDGTCVPAVGVVGVTVVDWARVVADEFPQAL